MCLNLVRTSCIWFEFLQFKKITCTVILVINVFIAIMSVISLPNSPPLPSSSLLFSPLLLFSSLLLSPYFFHSCIKHGEHTDFLRVPTRGRLVKEIDLKTTLGLWRQILQSDHVRYASTGGKRNDEQVCECARVTRIYSLVSSI